MMLGNDDETPRDSTETSHLEIIDTWNRDTALFVGGFLVGIVFLAVLWSINAVALGRGCP